MCVCVYMYVYIWIVFKKKKKEKKQRNHREYVLSLRPYYYYYYYYLGLYRASGLFSNRPQQQQQKADEKVRLVVCLQCPTRRIRYRRITRFSSAHPLRERKRRGRCVGSTFKHVRRAPLYPFPSPSLSSFLLPFLYFFSPTTTTTRRVHSEKEARDIHVSLFPPFQGLSSL